MVSLPDAVARPLARGAELGRRALGSVTWGPALAVAKPAVRAVLEQIEVGTLVLVDEPAGTRTVLGEGEGGEETNGHSNGHGKTNGKTNGHGKINGSGRTATAVPRTELVVHSEAFWVRALLFADMGFAEAYMLGETDCADLTAFFRLFLRNRARMGDGSTRLAALAAGAARLARTTNTLANALLNVSAHYDLGNDMFAAFLSPDMTYSCPVWAVEGEGGPEETLETLETLETAQMRKLDRFIDGARLRATDHVLEIGTGWGSLALRAAQRTGCRVTSLTLSREQKALADARIAAAGLAGRVQVLLLDYRALAGDPACAAPYDKIVSIEMLEAVGPEFLGTYFACVHALLKPDGGIAMFQCITMPEGRHEAYAQREDFINHYIFPGGYLPSTTQLLHHISRASHGTLVVEAVENIGGHYARALRLWREAFLARFDGTIRPALRRDHPGMSDAEMDVFRRKWEYYFSYCEAGFVNKTLGDVIITVGREGALELMEGIPL